MTPFERNMAFNQIETLIHNAEDRLKEAYAYRESHPDAELELSRAITCLYGATEEAKRLQNFYRRGRA